MLVKWSASHGDSSRWKDLPTHFAFSCLPLIPGIACVLGILEWQVPTRQLPQGPLLLEDVWLLPCFCSHPLQTATTLSCGICEHPLPWRQRRGPGLHLGDGALRAQRGLLSPPCLPLSGQVGSWAHTVGVGRAEASLPTPHPMQTGPVMGTDGSEDITAPSRSQSNCCWGWDIRIQRPVSS